MSVSRKNHPRIVQLLDVIETSTAFNIVMEYVAGKGSALLCFSWNIVCLIGQGSFTDLLKFILENENNIDESRIRRIFRQLVEAVLFCHKNNIVHRGNFEFSICYRLSLW